MQAAARQRVVLIRAEAPPKPAAGEPCNGCGVCCLFEPCPLGAVLSRRRRGPCSALQWDEAVSRYRCGALAEPGRHLRWLPAPWARRVVRRWIAAGTGCDANLDVGPS